MRFYNVFFVAAFALGSAVAYGQGQVPHADEKTPDMKKSAQTIDGKTMYEWMKVLKESKDPGVKVRAIHALQFYGKEAREVARAIIDALKNGDASVRVNAVIALGLIGLDAKDLRDGVDGLIHVLLYDNQGIVRYQAARALGRLGPDSAPAIPALVSNIKSRTASEIRSAVAYALGSAGWDSQKGPDPRAIHALLSVLNDDCHDVRMEALFSLIVLGPPAQAIDKAQERRALEALTHDKSKDGKVVDIWARVAIMRLDKVSPHHLAPIAKYLKDPDMRVRMNAARAFAIMGKDAKANVRDLTYALDDKEPDVLVWVCIALGEMRDAAQEALSKLEGFNEHQDPRVKQAAADAIGKIKAKARK
jgi:HEAT repeat protein